MYVVIRSLVGRRRYLRVSVVQNSNDRYSCSFERKSILQSCIERTSSRNVVIPNGPPFRDVLRNINKVIYLTSFSSKDDDDKTSVDLPVTRVSVRGDYG